MPKFNNQFKVPNEKATEIVAASHKNLVTQASIEYENWQAVKSQKKNDPQIQNVRNELKELEAAIKEDPRYQELEDEYKTRKEELITEEHATLKEELKNLNEPYNEDIKSFENLFKLCMEEIKTRKEAGLLDL
jgi:chromosome segregation ATPase